MRQRRPGKFKLAMAVVSLLSLSAFTQSASAKARHTVSHGHRNGSVHKITFSTASYHASGRYAGGRCTRHQAAVFQSAAAMAVVTSFSVLPMPKPLLM